MNANSSSTDSAVLGARTVDRILDAMGADPACAPQGKAPPGDGGVEDGVGGEELRRDAVATRVLGDRRAAEALAGEVFVDLWRHPGEFGANDAPLRAGLLSRSNAADRLVFELLPALRRRPRRNAPARASASATRSGSDSGYSDPPAGDLSLLSARERDVIELACFPGHTYVDFAMLCGLDEAVVKRCIRSGLGRMADAGRTSRGGGRRRRGVRRQPPRRPA